MHTTAENKKQTLVIAVSVIIAVILIAATVWLFALGGLAQIRAFSSLQNINNKEIREAFLKISETNPEAAGYVANFDGPEELDTTIDVSDDLLSGGIPYFRQWDYRWGYMCYGSGLIGYTGCGPTCLSMILSGLTGDCTASPAFVADFAVRNGYCVTGNGTSWTLFSEGANSLGLISKELPLDESVMHSELDAGRPIICIMGPGDFTETGHYIVITDYTEDGFSVLDPNRPSNNKDWSYEQIYSQIRNLWSYSA